MKKIYSTLIVIVLLLAHTCIFCQELIAYFPFNHNADDVSGYRNSGIKYGGVETCEDRFGNPCGAFRFNGIDGFIKVNNSLSLQSIDQSFSFTCWFKLEESLISDNKWLSFICKGANTLESQTSPQYRVQMFQSNTQSTISMSTDFTEYDANYNNHVIDFGQWLFYALIYNGSTVSVYLNDTKIWDFPYNGVFNTSTDPLYIGMDIPGNLEYYSGALDEMRIYRGVLSEDRILELYNDESGLFFEEDFEIECPGNIRIPVLYGNCNTTVYYPQAELKINCGTAKLQQTFGLVSGSLFEVGTHLITFEAIGQTGQQRSCTTKITVEDKDPPTMTCPGDTIIYTKQKEKTMRYNFSNPLAFDNCSGVLVKQTKGLRSGDLFGVGETIQEFIAVDENGNSSICRYVVKVIEARSIVILDSLICPENILKTNDFNKCGAVISYDFPKQSNEIKLAGGLPSGGFFPIGTTTNIFQKIVGLNPVDSCRFLVRVEDMEKPVIACIQDLTVYVNDGFNGSEVTYNMPIISDNCGVKSITQTEGLKSGSFFPIGSSRNVFNVIDIHGNSSSCYFSITVKDTMKHEPIDNIAQQVQNQAIIPDTIIDNGVIRLDDCIITVVIYDDNIEDSDTISIYFNNEEIVKKEKIKLKKNGTIIKELYIDPKLRNIIVVKAWNNGAISPNTLRIDFYNGSFLGKENLLNFTKPYLFRVLHSSPGIAASIDLNCKNVK